MRACARNLHIYGTAADIDVGIAFDALAVIASDVAIKRTSSHVEGIGNLDTSLAFRRRVDGQVTIADGHGSREIEAVGTCRCDVEGATIPLQVAAAVDAVTVGVEDADGARVDRHRAFHSYAVFGIARDTQSAQAAYVEAACGIKCCIEAAIGTVGNSGSASQSQAYTYVGG